MITIYEVKTGNPIITFHARNLYEGISLRATATALCERINQEFKCGAVAIRFAKGV